MKAIDSGYGLPGGEYFFAASSRTRTQSSPEGGRNSASPFASNSPAGRASPVRGSNHQHVTARPEILPASTRMDFPEGL